MNHHAPTPSSEGRQSSGYDPRTTTKRHSGLFSFFKWFKTSTSRESIDTENSSSSCESLNSVKSSGTVASFSYVPPGDYNKEQIGEKKCIPLGPETDTYKARLKQRDKRRESDKNLTLRKKYNLFFNRDTLLRRIVSKKSDEDNTKSLPLMTRADDMELIEEEKFHRRTNSESSKIKKAGAYLHVKGKRKAPQPPKENPSTSSLRRKKRLAPSPPSKKATSVEEEKYTSINYADADIICNDSLKLDHGILKPAKEIGFNKVLKSSSDQNVPNLYSSKKSSRCSYVEPPVSPRPWYKRHSNRDSLYGSRDDNKYEPIEKLPEVPFKRSSIADLYEETKIEKKREEKRKSGLTFLTNISELDREASEIVRKEHSKIESDIVSELPEFMKPKPDSSKVNTDSWVSPKRRSAKDLIAKFNAITSVTKVTVNSAFFGGGMHQKDKHLFGNGKSEEKKQEILLQSHKKKIEQIGKKNQENLNNAVMMNPILKSESTSAIKVKPDTPKSERKPWNCPKCGLQNDYWRIICYVCSAIKPYFDDIATPNNKNDNVKKSPILRKITPPKINPPVGFLERSKTQIGFSALASYNNNSKNKNNDDTENYSKQDDKKEEREKLKRMLIDMKNSLPKRKSELKKQNNRTSVILEKSERDIEQIKTDISQQTKLPEKEQKIAEVIIATSETIYENIKVRKTEIEKPTKISASAQTNPIKNQKTPPEATEDKNGFELMRPKDFEDIYSDQNSKSAARIYANLARNDELSLFFNMPKPSDTPTGFNRTETRNNTDTIEINRLLKRLENAIAKGELTEASIFAKELAQLKVNCSVVRQKSNSPPKTVEVGFSIEMYVEDKLSHRGPFSIQVTEKQTLLELKRQVQKEFEIPVEVQRWILGKELATNDEYTLKKYNITQGCPIFLYLVAPENKSPVVNPKRSVTETETASQGPSKPVDKNDPKLIPKTIEKIESQKNPEPLQEKTSAPKIVSVIPKVVESISREQQKLNSGRVKLNEIKLVKQKSIEIKPIIIDVSSKAIPIHNYTPEVNHIDDAKPTSSKNSEVTNDQTNDTKANQEMLLQLKKDEDYDNETLKPQKEWECRLCTLLNPVTSNICAVCASLRGKDQKGKKIKKQTVRDNHSDNDQTYRQLVNLDNTDIVNNVEPFECAICFLDIPPSQGVTLRECLHQFCKVCLAQTIEYSEEAEVKCPYRDDQYSCNIALQDREVKALVSPVAYEKFLAKSISQAENKIGKSFHCKSPDCKGWCIFEDNVNDFRCPVCNKINCLTCQAIHTGLNCRQYQERMKDESGTNEEARRTKEMLEEMVNKGEAIACPTCQVILMKKWGCDWLRCSMCKTEICWVTRGPRWGPAGKGDISGGCQCGVNGVKCHPQCSYCH